MKINKSKNLPGLFVLFGMFSTLISCQSGQNERSAKQQINNRTQTVEVVKPIERSFNTELLITGTAFPNQMVMIYAMESGYVKVIHKDIGDVVKKGDIIAELDNPELDRMHEKLMAHLESKKSNYERLRLIREKTPDLTPLQVLEEAKAEYLAAVAELGAVEDRRGFLMVKAPFSGTITKRAVDLGALVQSGLTEDNPQGIMEIQEFDPIRLRIPLPEADAVAVTKGMVVLVTFPELAGAAYKAEVSRMAGALDFASKTMQIEIDIPNADKKIKTGMYAKAVMQISSRENVLSLPVTSKFLYQDEPFIFVVKNNKVERIQLRTGLSNKDFFEVLNAEIDTESLVITQGKGLVKHGQLVKPVLKTK